MNIEESIKQKKEELVTAIDETQALIDDPNSSAEDSQKAMDKVKQIEKDIKDLQALQQSKPDDEDSTPEPTPDHSTKNDPEPPTEDDAPDDDTSKDNTEDDVNDDKKDEERSMPVEIKQKEQKLEARDAFNAFLRTKGEKREGLTSADAAVVIPEEIIYNPDMELQTVTDLSKFVTKTKVSTASGKYPILKRPSDVLPSVAELEKNPSLANPDFKDVAWEIETYRGAIPISQEALDDAQIDLSSLVAQHIQTLKVNTTNAKIAATLSTFTAKTLTTEGLVDGLKGIVNAELDPAYTKSFIMTQSMYDTLDKLKDEEGRYLLQNQIGSPSGKSLFGLQVEVLKDNAFNSADKTGTKKLWVGDLYRAALYADRADISVQWVWNDIYGRILQAVLRLDVEAADTEAGFMVTVDDSTTEA